MKNLDDYISLASLLEPSPEIVKHYVDVPEIVDVDNRGYRMVRPLFAHSDFPAMTGIERVREDKINYDEEFIYCVYLHHHDALSAKYINKLPEKVLEAVRKRKCKLILDNALEGDRITDFITQLYISSIKYNLPLNQIYYITNNLVGEYEFQRWKEEHITLVRDTGGTLNGKENDVNILSFMYNVYDIDRLVNINKLPPEINLDEEIDYKEKNLDKVKHFLKLNRTGRAERDIFMLHVNKYNLYDKFKLSYATHFGVENLAKHVFPHLRDKANIDSLKAKMPFDVDESDASNHGEPGIGPGKYDADLPFNPSHYRDTFMSTVLCAFPFVPNTCHLHSSTFNPIWCGHPILQLGPWRSLYQLKLRGFLTFDRWWDESYDDEYYCWGRTQKILEVVDYLSKKTPEEMLQMYKEMKPILQHNINIMKEYNGKKVLQKFIGYEQ